MNFFVTFGQKYRTEPHPKVKYAHPDGWLTVEAHNREAAHAKAFSELGEFFATMYSEESFESKKQFFPRGELHKI